MKKKVIVLVTILCIVLISLILGWYFNQEKVYNITQANKNWVIYDYNLENIKQNMDEITIENEDFYWWELKDFEIDDKTYTQILNLLVADIRMCYLELNREREEYKNSNPILNYRNKEEITEQELLELNKQISLQKGCLFKFERYSNIVLSKNAETSKILLKKIDVFLNEYQKTKDNLNNLDYTELLNQKVIETSLLSELSSWIRSEYYRLK